MTGKKLAKAVAILVAAAALRGCGFGVPLDSLESLLGLEENPLYGWTLEDSIPFPDTSSSLVTSRLFTHNDLLLAVRSTGSDTSYSCSPIAEDGSLSGWSAAVPLVDGDGDNPGHEVAFHDGYLYFFADARSYHVAQVGSDGTVGTINLVEGTGPDSGVMWNSQIAFSGEHIYITGGGGDFSDPVASVYYATVDSSGYLVYWGSGPEFETGRRGHGCVAADGWLYIIGGSGDTNDYLADIQRAAVGSDGALSAWESVGSLPYPFGEFCYFTAAERFLVYLGKINKYYAPSVVFWAELGDAGSLGAWKVGRDQLTRKPTALDLSLDPDSVPKVSTEFQGAAAVHGNAFYNVAGTGVIRATVME